MSTRPETATLIAKSDIAEIAGVGRSTVSNWTTRHEDFPTPAGGTSTSPRYDESEVRDWLTKNRPDLHIRTLPIDGFLWSMLDGWRGIARLEESAEVASTLIVWRYVSEPESPGFSDAVPVTAQWPALVVAPDDQLVARISDGMRAFDEQRGKDQEVFDAQAWRSALPFGLADRPILLRIFLDALSTISAARLSEAYIALQDRLTKSARRGYDESATSDTLTDLLQQVSASLPGPVHDPAAGSGRLLLAVAASGEQRDRLTGQEIYASACLQARRRAMLARIPAAIYRQDAFAPNAFGPARAGVVVLDPPFGVKAEPQRLALDARLPFGAPPGGRMDFAWLQLAVWHLRAEGRAFVLQPPSSAWAAGGARDIRAKMLQAGVIEAVVALPPGLLGRTNIAVSLWVLARPGETADPHRVLMMDVRDRSEPDSAAIARALHRWRETKAVPVDLPAAAPTMAELAASDFNLSPDRWFAVATPAPELDDVREQREELGRRLAELKLLEAPAATTLRPSERVPRLVTIGEIIKAGNGQVLRSRERNIKGATAEQGAPVVTGDWVRSGTLTERVNLATLEHPPVITQPGDVVVVNTGELAARVDADGGGVLLSHSFVVLRVDPSIIDPNYLAAMIPTRANAAIATGTTIRRFPVLELRVPLVPLTEQQRFTAHLAELDRLKVATSDLSQAISRTEGTLVDALAAGSVAFVEAP